MSIDSRTREALVAALVADGWRLEHDALVSPGATLWLSSTDPVWGSLVELRDRMLGRLERARSRGDPVATTDLESLVAALETLAPDGLVRGFFDSLEGTLTTFAEAHNLRLVKYPQGAQSWALVFRHPKSGVGKVEICRHSGQEVELVGYWWIDDHSSGTRRSHRQDVPPFLADPTMVAARVSELFDCILAWTDDVLHNVRSGFSWQPCSEEEAEAELEWYPDPVP